MSKKEEFPEPVHYSRTDAPGWKIRDWDTANELLGHVDPNKRPYAIFERLDGSYIQCLGSKTRLTVEARTCGVDNAFRHVVFGKGPVVGTRTLITASTGDVEVDESQVLKMRDARLIIRAFLVREPTPGRYVEEDVSSRFEPEPPDRS